MVDLLPDPPAPVKVDVRRLRLAMGRAALNPGPGGGFLARVGELLDERLDGIRLEPRRILELGGRDPQLAPRLARRFPRAGIISLTLSELHAPAGSITALPHQLPFARESFDLVVSNLALHWSGDLRRALLECRRVLNHDGLLLFSIPGADMLHEVREALAQWDRARGCVQARFPPLPDLRGVGDGLAAAGFAVPVADRERMSAPFPSVEELLRGLRQMGAIQAMSPRCPGLTGKGWLSYLERAMGIPSPHGPFQATLEVLFGHGWKPPLPGKK